MRFFFSIEPVRSSLIDHPHRIRSSRGSFSTSRQCLAPVSCSTTGWSVAQWSRQKLVTSQQPRIIKRENHPITLNYAKLSPPQCRADSKGRKSKLEVGVWVR